MSDVLNLPWFRCFPAKLLTLLAAMGADEKLVFMIILLRLYETGGPINDDDRALAHRCGISPRRVTDARTRLFATGVLVSVGDDYTNPAAQQEIEDRTKLVKEKSDLQSFRRRGGKKTQENQSTTPTSGQSSVTTGQPEVTHLHSDLQHSPSESEAQSAAHSPAGSKAGKSKPLCRIADDWALSEVGRDYAKQQGLDDKQIAYVAEKFHNHWLQAPDRTGKKKDWEAAWRKWVTDEIVDFKKGVENIPRKMTRNETAPAGPAFVVVRSVPFHKWRGFHFLTGTSEPELIEKDGKQGWIVPSEYPPYPTVRIKECSDQERAWRDYCRGSQFNLYAPSGFGCDSLAYSEWPPDRKPAEIIQLAA
jgi:uncharacterized protein YdaU (DUF1376 family)